MERLSEQVLARDTPTLTHTGGGNRLLVRRYRYDAGGPLAEINDTRSGQLV